MSFGAFLGDLFTAGTGGFQRREDQRNLQAAEQANVDRTNAANQAIAQKQMDFQRDMSNTAWQRGTADMAKAGINPILAATAGAASTPSGAAIASQKADFVGATNAATNIENSRINNKNANTARLKAITSLAAIALGA